MTYTVLIPYDTKNKISALRLAKKYVKKGYTLIESDNVCELIKKIK